MNDKFTDYNRDEDIAQKINRVAEQTNVNSQFAAELEERLRSAHKPKRNWFAVSFKRVSPVVLWVALMALLILVLSLSITTLIPAPQPAKNSTPTRQGTSTPPMDDSIENKTPIPNGESFDYDGAKLIMSVPLPDSPGQASVYTLLDPQPATVEYARTLANQFGIDGEIYIAEGHNQDTSAFMVTDGKQQLIVHGNNDYTYTSDMVKSSRYLNGFRNENAETIIREYLKAHGLDFNFRFNSSSPYAYYLEQLAPDGTSMERAYYLGPYMSITLDENGSILGLTSMLANYDPNPLGEYRIISASSALENLLDTTNSAGEVQGSGSSPGPNPDYVPPKYWFHDYPNDETVTTYGEVASGQAVDATKPAVVFIDNVPAIGNTNGMDSLNNFAFVQATGRFIVENGIREFNVDTWDQTQQANSVGSARGQGDQVIIEDQSGSSYVLADPPADLPLDLELPEGFFVRGAAADGTFYWTSIQYLKDINHLGGGGGGGGMGFYQLNLTGTPVPFSTAIAAQHKYSRAEIASFLRYTVQPGDTLEQIAKTYNVPIEDLMSVNYLTDSNISPDWQLTIPGVPGPTHLDGERGIVQFQLFEKPDGRQRAQYTFTSEKDRSNYELTGDNLEPLQKAANRPIKVWGSLSFDERGTVFLHLEKFEVLYPDLQFQILKGTQQAQEINGSQVGLFTTGGTTYVELELSGGYPTGSYLDMTGDATIEALQVPGETYAGYPALRVYILQNNINPDTGEVFELAPVADLHEVVPDPYGNADSYTPPDITIEKVELVYFADDSHEMDAETGSPPHKYYVQPAWRFFGHTTDGGEIDFLIQALDQEYLLPTAEP